MDRQKSITLTALLAALVLIVSFATHDSRSEECKQPGQFADLAGFAQKYGNVKFLSYFCQKVPDFASIDPNTCGPKAEAAYRFLFNCTDHKKFAQIRAWPDILLKRALLKAHFDRELELLGRLAPSLPGIDKEWAAFQSRWNARLKSVYGVGFTDSSPYLVPDEHGNLQSRVLSIPRFHSAIKGAQRAAADAFHATHPTANDLLIAQSVIDTLDSPKAHGWLDTRVAEAKKAGIALTLKDAAEQEKDIIYSKYPELLMNRSLRYSLRKLLDEKPQINKACLNIFNNPKTSRTELILGVNQEVIAALAKEPRVSDKRLSGIEAFFLAAFQDTRKHLDDALGRGLRDEQQRLWGNRALVASALADINSNPSAPPETKLLRETLNVLYCGSAKLSATEDRVNRIMFTTGIAVATAGSVGALATGFLAASATALALDSLAATAITASSTLTSASVIGGTVMMGTDTFRQHLRYNRLKREFYSNLSPKGNPDTRERLEDANSARIATGLMTAIGLIPLKSAVKQLVPGSAQENALQKLSTKAKLKHLAGLGFFAAIDGLWLMGAASEEEP